MQSLVKDDIIGCIDENLQIGNITLEDATKLKRYLLRLCDYLSRNYKELEVLSDMTDVSYMTDVDIYYEKLHALEDALAERDAELAEKNNELAIKDNELATKDNELATKDNELAALKQQLAHYQS